MNYIERIEINKPIEEVITLFNNPKYYTKWMPGVSTHEIIKGKNKEAGSVSMYQIMLNGKDNEMNESIIKNNGPEILAEYTINGIVNTQKTTFIALDNETTLYQIDENFDLKGFLKIIGFFLPGMFKKQTKKFALAFKNFAENKK
ncbi:SRPBCC family protein [uncultured Polaribacter sp.]|uniref:SRPBCC family protein n=1 Tax=uncultured Polaribacter sp. TaxID=174711 RepID=UPI0026395663|nr:SRPBCC family protein [uncultured Polaribacter sp.]